MEIRKCKYCGKPLKPVQKVFCSHACKYVDKTSMHRPVVWQCKKDNPSWSLKQIAAHLHLGYGTVRNALYNVSNIPPEVGVKKNPKIR